MPIMIKITLFIAYYLFIYLFILELILERPIKLEIIDGECPCTGTRVIGNKISSLSFL